MFNSYSVEPSYVRPDLQDRMIDLTIKFEIEAVRRHLVSQVPPEDRKRVAEEFCRRFPNALQEYFKHEFGEDFGLPTDREYDRADKAHVEVAAVPVPVGDEPRELRGA